MPSSRLGSLVYRHSRAAALILAGALGSAAWAAQPSPEIARARDLRALVLNDCGSCHGMTLRGGLGPALLPETLAPKGQAFVAEMIRVGNPANAMPAWGSLLSPSDITWIAQSLVEGRLLNAAQP